MKDRSYYDGMNRAQLEERLRLAEDVCVLFGWTAVRSGTERDDALNELWQVWAREAGRHALSPAANPHLNDEAIHKLGEQRRKTRQWALARLNPDTAEPPVVVEPTATPEPTPIEETP